MTRSINKTLNRTIFNIDKMPVSLSIITIPHEDYDEILNEIKRRISKRQPMTEYGTVGTDLYTTKILTINNRKVRRK